MVYSVQNFIRPNDTEYSGSSHDKIIVLHHIDIVRIQALDLTSVQCSSGKVVILVEI